MVEIWIDSDYITLGQFLKFSNVVSSGGEVKYFLEENKIFVNEIEENRRGKKLFSGDLIKINGKIFVIRSKNDN